MRGKLIPPLLGYYTMAGGVTVPATPWYLSGGVASSDVAAVWEPSSAADLASSYLRVAGDEGNANLDPAVVGIGSAPGFSSGWSCNGSANFLASGVIPTANTSIIIQYSDLVYENNDVLVGQYNDVGGAACCLIQTVNDHMRVYHGTTASATSGVVLTSGIYALCGKTPYRNGIPETAVSAGTATTDYKQMYIAANNYRNGTHTGYAQLLIKNLAIYKSVLTYAQERAIATALGWGGRLVAFGDSVTSGNGATDEAHRWANIVATDLGTELVNSGTASTVLQNTVQNTVSTIGAASDNNGRDTYTTRVINYYPTRVVILYGLNDLRLNDVAFTDALFQNDLGEIVDALVTAGISADNIVIGSPPYIPEASYSAGTPYNAGSRIKHAAYVAACAAVATAKGCVYVDVYQAMADGGGDDLISVDGIHPNDDGHAVIAAAILAAL